MRLFIEPVEPLLFRDGRPFNAGESNFALSLFPPTPETLQGAIRATIATHLMPDATPAQAFSNEIIKDLIGSYNYYGRFRIIGFSLGRYLTDTTQEEDTAQKGIERLFPVPTCILQEEKGEKRTIRLIPRDKEDGISTDMPDTMRLLYPDPKTKLEHLNGKLEPLKGWLTEQSLYDFLQNKGTGLADDLIKDGEIYTRESRLGIGIDNAAKATQEGLLYQLQMIRMNHNHQAEHRYGFVVDISLAPKDDRDTKDPQRYLNTEQTYEELRLGSTHFPDEGWMTLGGERRAARFQVIKPEAAQTSLDSAKSGTFIYLATPAALTRGWQPENWSDVGIADNPISIAIDRYQPIGGWLLDPNHSGGQGKTMRRCVPTGTVYYFNKPVQITRPFTDYGKEIGYGIAYAGEY